MATNLIFNMPFDESDGATTAYDYSSSRADGSVVGAHFISGKNGNAIEFGGNDYCEVTKRTLSSMNQNFTIFAWVNTTAVETGSPTMLIWVLNFAGLNKQVEIPIEAAPGSWLNMALTRSGNIYSIYVNSSLIQTIQNTGTLLGVALNQDFYGGDYGKGLLDDVKIYDSALTQAELIEESANNKKIAYFVDGVDFTEFGVYVSGSDGILNRPKMKTPASLNWDNYHGESVDLMHKFYESREITLSCFIKASSRIDFIKQINAFENAFNTKGTNRLVIDVHPVKPLIYEVYCKDEIEITKQWDDNLMVGTFKLKLIEPEPVKRVLKHIRVGESTKQCQITLTSAKLVNIYWGDGSADYDVSGDDRQITHDYAINGDYFPVITGCIDEITKFNTNAIIVWEQI